MQAPSTAVSGLESFAIHLRNLIEFFFFQPDGDYVRATHFLDDPSAWLPNKRPEMNKLLKRASNEVTHLTTKRISGSPPEKNWYTTEALNHIEAVAKEFAAKASPNKLHANVREFLNLPAKELRIWIEKNIDHHPNVATNTITFDAAASSTATAIVGAPLIKE